MTDYRRAAKKRISVFLAFILAVSAALAGVLTGCGREGASMDTNAVEKESYYFDTVCQIAIYDMKDMSQKNAGKAIDRAFKQCVRYEDLLSKTEKGTDIYKVNHAGGAFVECDPITVECVKKGIEYGDLSGGLFDITVGKAEDLYDFHAEKHVVPTDEQLSQAVASVNYKEIQIDGNRIAVGNGGEIDLGGIGKGYVADKIAEYLKSLGVTSAVISLGGNIACVGEKGDMPFKIGIEKPFSDEKEVLGYVNAKDLTLVTSGIYERYFRKNGKLYHHILDPKTGKPVDTDTSGVTIVSKSGHSGDCDAIATICLMLGSKEGKKFVESQDGYEALFVKKNGKIVKTSGMKFHKDEQSVG